METTILIAPFDGPHAVALAAEARLSGRKTLLALRGDSSSPPRFSETDAEADSFAPAEIEVGAATGNSASTDSGASPGSPGNDENRALATVQAEKRRSPIMPGISESDSLSIPWNPSSYISTGGLLLAARNALGEIHSAIIICDPGAERAAGGRSDLFGGTPGGSQAYIEENCLGPALLIRELVRRFRARRSGRILLLYVDREAEAPLGPSQALIAGAFKGLGEGLFSAAKAEAAKNASTKTASWSAFGVADSSGSPEATARFALKLMDDPKAGKAGRWLRFAGKSGIFGVF